MKRLILLTCIIVLTGIFACNKKDEIPDNKQFPEWLQLKIDELIPDQDLCTITTVSILEYKGKKYYHVYCGLWSCMYCQLFDEKGNRPNWETDEWNDFFTNEKEIKTLPACH